MESLCKLTEDSTTVDIYIKPVVLRNQIIVQYDIDSGSKPPFMPYHVDRVKTKYEQTRQWQMCLQSFLNLPPIFAGEGWLGEPQQIYPS